MKISKFLKWILSDFIAIVMLSALISPFAASMGVLADSDGALNDNVFPYQKTFTISAYYSPLPCQSRYTTGSYEGDIRLNGRGVSGADGTGVYPGMVAAPKNYAFGTKLYIPSVGIVAVHDRGGAIVSSNGEDGRFDRLDIWMGYGDIGLTRALNWGKRNVEVTVYGLDADIMEEVVLDGYSESEAYPQDCSLTDSVVSDESNLEEVELDIESEPAVVEEESNLNDFPSEIVESVEISSNVGTTLAFGDSGASVVALQEELSRLNFYLAEPNGVYDDMTKHAVFKFQQSMGIVSSNVELGAGVFGPKTSTALNKFVDSRNYTKVLIASTTSDYFQNVNGNFIADAEKPADPLLASF